jgi:phosphatidate cytidylyltransferase
MTIVPTTVRPSSESPTTQVVIQRILYGTLAIIVLVLLFALDGAVARWAERLEGAVGDLLRRGSVVPLMFLVVLHCGAVELSHLLRATGARPHVLFAHLMITVLLLTPWLLSAGWLGSPQTGQAGLDWQAVWLMIAAVGTGILGVARREPSGTFRDIGATWIMVLHLGLLGSFGLHLRCGMDASSQAGVWLLMTVVLVTKASDIGGFFVGSAFGRHKLCPPISPGKSIEGTIGGIAGSALLAILICVAPSLASAMNLGTGASALLEDCARPFAAGNDPGALPSLWRAFSFGVAMSVAGQLGDLVESCFKRDAGSKDSGRIIPRFGGILDLIDSPVLALPVAWFLLAVVWDAV